MRIAAWLTLLAGTAAHLAGQPMTKAESGGSKVGVLHVQGNVYLVYGAGANITAQVGDQIVTLVDSGLPEYSEEVRAAIRTVSSKPIGYIINTGIEKDHTGGNGNLAKGGFFMLESANESRPQASVVSHLRLLERRSKPEDPEDKAQPFPPVPFRAFSTSNVPNALSNKIPGRWTPRRLYRSGVTMLCGRAVLEFFAAAGRVTRRSYGFRAFEAMEIALYHNFGRFQSRKRPLDSASAAALHRTTHMLTTQMTTSPCR